MSPGAVWVMYAGEEASSPMDEDEPEPDEKQKFRDSDDARRAARAYLRDRCGSDVEVEELVEGGSLFVKARNQPYSVRIERKLTTEA